MVNEDFTRMALWQKAQGLAATIIRVVSALPHDRPADIIGAQVLRSAGSVPANIAEGFGRYSQASYRSHLSIARGSLFETESWIDLLYRGGYISDESRVALLNDCHTVGRLLTLRMKSLGEARQSYAREEGPAYEVQ